MYDLCDKTPGVLSVLYAKKGGLLAKDAIHLACACYMDADFFLTCDDRLIKQAKRLKLEIVVMNPVDYIRQEVTHGEDKDNG